MDLDHFKTQLTADGYGEITTVERGAGYTLGTHTHPFDAKALITQGDITLVVAGESTLYRTGDIFALPAHTPHEEHALPHGVTYVVGRRIQKDN